MSQEWIDEHEEQEEMYGTYGVPVRKLENLLMPKQELPVAPMWFDEWWKDVTKGGGNLFHNIERFYDELFSSGTREAYNYIISPDNKKKLLNIIINELEYEVESEQKYYVLDSEDIPLLERENNHRTCKTTTALSIYETYIDKSQFALTEQEIKDYDERYLAFKVPVEEVGQ